MGIEAGNHASENGRTRVIPFRNPQAGDLVAQTHYHTKASDSFAETGVLVESAISEGINVLIITDHDKTHGAFSALIYAENHQYINKTNRKDHFEVIIGQEVTTDEDEHVLIWGAKTSILCGLPVDETVEAARSQDGLVIIPHPGFSRGQGMSYERVNNLIARGLVDGMEIRNGAQETLTYTKYILAAFPGGKALGRRISSEPDSNIVALRHFMASGGRQYAVIGGQDGHLAHASSVAKVVTLFPEGMTFFDAVREKKTVYSTKNQPEVWGLKMYFTQDGLSQILEEDRIHNRDGIMCLTICEQ